MVSLLPDIFTKVRCSQMNIAPAERRQVKFECLRLLATLRLDVARMQLISGFIDTYLRLNADEEKLLRRDIARIEPVEQEAVMKIVTSWMEQGIEQGIEQGKQSEARSLIMRLLTRRIGTVEPQLQERIQK
jgi:hypothetical protein